MAEIEYKICKHIGNISQPNNGWTKELNLISWNNCEPVYDLRTWNADHSRMGKGVTITAGEMAELKKLIDGMDRF